MLTEPTRSRIHQPPLDTTPPSRYTTTITHEEATPMKYDDAIRMSVTITQPCYEYLKDLAHA